MRVFTTRDGNVVRELELNGRSIHECIPIDETRRWPGFSVNFDGLQAAPLRIISDSQTNEYVP